MTRDFENVYAIILAAGASRRLGSPKQLLEWRGRTLLGNTIENARSL
ncbi:MAG: NTP transferase domain-containing protein, partial [Methylomicrobium sp.]|nr:NTP transferase domain-containing protein [Methylomicrobium sp.]